MTTTLGAKEAAQVISQSINQDASSRLHPDEVHRTAYVKEVCSHLGMEATPENVEHVRAKLHENGIEPHVGAEFPKYVVRGSATSIVNSPEEEHRFMHPDEHEGDNDPVLNPPDPNPKPHSDAERPIYEPGAGPTEPGAPNRPTAQAPVARPTSDNNFGDRHDATFGDVGVDQRTPNPQPDIAGNTALDADEFSSHDASHGTEYDAENDDALKHKTPVDDGGFPAADILTDSPDGPQKLNVPVTKGPKQGVPKRPE